MRLVVDTSVLVGELLRRSGRERLGDDRLDLFAPDHVWDEAVVELPRRAETLVAHRGLDPALGTQLAAMCLASVAANVDVLDVAVYGALEDEARARSLRDPSDWPVVAAALAVSGAIWTNDNDFLGVGVATWITDTLRVRLARQAARDTAS